MRIAVACGGTGGHIFPGFATANVLRSRGHDVTLWLAGRDIETTSLSGWDGPVTSVRAVGFPRGLSLRAVAALFRSGLAVLRCLAAMRAQRPDVLLAMGSYASIGPVLAAHWLRVPVVLHEANAVPGRAIVRLARYARVLAVCFDDVRGRFPSVRTVVTGLPVRADAVADGVEPILPPDRCTVLVMGGSLGAHRLNEVASRSLCRLHEEGIDLQIIHLSGRNDESEVKARYDAAGVRAQVFGFLCEMARAYRNADLAVARSGAASCTELAVCALPALLVPYPHAVNDHQMANARAMAAGGGMDVIAEADLTVDYLVEYLRDRIADGEKRAAMKAALAGTVQENADERLADIVEETT
jgi:UDP-N-acetylglucosamine--N-acetylmuramyl-(pentapeptide) pyrophosphoryl-undecaprenol N-acetylglucosamine transferase